MCLAIPSRVIEIKDGSTAIVDTMGSKRIISTILLEEPPSVGDYLLIHVGYAMQKIDFEEAALSLSMFKEIRDGMD